MRIALFGLDERYSVCNRQSFLNVQVALLSILSHSSVIVYPVGHIGILLDLRNQDIRADGVDCTGLNKEYVSFLHRNFIEHVQHRVILDPFREFFLTDLLFKPIIEGGVFSCIYHVPHLCLSILPFIFESIPVIRMYLNRQVLLCIDELDQNREVPESPAVVSKHSFSFCFYVFCQCLSGIPSVGDPGRTIRMA